MGYVNDLPIVSTLLVIVPSAREDLIVVLIAIQIQDRPRAAEDVRADIGFRVAHLRHAMRRGFRTGSTAAYPRATPSRAFQRPAQLPGIRSDLRKQLPLVNCQARELMKRE